MKLDYQLWLGLARLAITAVKAALILVLFPARGGTLARKEAAYQYLALMGLLQLARLLQPAMTALKDITVSCLSLASSLTAHWDISAP